MPGNSTVPNGNNGNSTVITFFTTGSLRSGEGWCVALKVSNRTATLAARGACFIPVFGLGVTSTLSSPA